MSAPNVSRPDPSPPTERELSRALALVADERALVARVREGDEEAFATLYRAHYSALRAFAQGYVGTVGEADEVVQDVFLRLWARRRAWLVTGTVRAYLFGAARNAAINAARNRRAQWRWSEAFAREPHPVGMAAEVRQGEEAAVDHDVDAAVARVIGGLPERCRLVYTLRWHHDLSYPEIAETLGISIKTVERHISRALVTLRKRLRHYR